MKISGINTRHFKKILVANRGEIACRIFRTLQRLAIPSVAIYSAAEANALHVQLADQHYCMSGNAHESYLNITAIIDVAQKAGCDAIHPGYGFLSENTDFAKACASAGICFIGPSPRAIEQMGDKATAKQLVQSLDIPVIPGYYGDQQDLASLTSHAKEIGYPLLIKPTQGGGGKGMAIVYESTTFESQCKSAQRLAKRSFNNDRLMLEKYFPKARHIEVQIFGDTAGNVLHLFERECSIQRRYQKIIEECPAPHLAQGLRDSLTAAAICIAQTMNYVSAGTVEFLVAGQDFYFIEMNTRLQVEHPVTEMTTGIDLVEWQLIVASGGDLPLKQAAIRCQGHAIEARLYAEDPLNQFMPATGHVLYLHFPEPTQHRHIDNGIQSNDTITAHYDPLLAKLITYGDNREQAIQRFKQLLAQTCLLGVATNRDFLRKIVDSTAFQQGTIDTQFIDKQDADFWAKPPPTTVTIALAALYLALGQTQAAQENADLANEPNSPWALADSWRLSTPAVQFIQLYSKQRDTETGFKVALEKKASHYSIKIGELTLTATGQRVDNSAQFTATIDNQAHQAIIISDKDCLHCFHHNEIYRFNLTASTATDSRQLGHNSLHTPMPGVVVKVAIKAGDTVKRGDTLMVIEAMKMEHTIAAPTDATIKAVHFQVGDPVEEGERLLELD